MSSEEIIKCDSFSGVKKYVDHHLGRLGVIYLSSLRASFSYVGRRYSKYRPYRPSLKSPASVIRTVAQDRIGWAVAHPIVTLSGQAMYSAHPIVCQIVCHRALIASSYSNSDLT